MEFDKLENLELQVEKIIKKYLELKEENSILKEKLKSKRITLNPSDSVNYKKFELENGALREKNSKAAVRLKALLGNLENNSIGF